MSLKQKIALNLSIVFSLLFGALMVTIYFSFSDFRKEEFKERFTQRLSFTVQFIANARNFEKEAPLYFIEDKDNILLNENILIFNKHKSLIYSTIKNKNVTWDENLLSELDHIKTIYQPNSTPEIYAALRQIKGENYYIITSAQDVNGESKIKFLRNLLIGTFLVSILIIGILTYYFLDRFLKPLEQLNDEISEVTVHNLTTPISIKKTGDEVAVLADSFNTMLTKLSAVFEAQKSFTASASHEIKTPLTRIAFQVENLIQFSKQSPQTLDVLKHIKQNVFQLADLTNSLLLLAKFDQDNIHEIFEETRIDEVVFDAYSHVNVNFPNLALDFKIKEGSQKDPQLLVHGVRSLLEIVFTNLFKNVALYGEDHRAEVVLFETQFFLYIEVNSKGKEIPKEEQEKMFEAFVRGNNSQMIPGSGLGLRIVKRILQYHHASIEYRTPTEDVNQFLLSFLKSKNMFNS